MIAFRLLVTEPLDGAANMALDEALLQARLARPRPPTLRFFSWAPPTISLGYGQALDGRVDLAAAADMELGLVRRPTGGSAILHEGPDLEVTYSVVAGVGDFPGPTSSSRPIDGSAAPSSAVSIASARPRTWFPCNPRIPPRCPPSASREPARTSSR